MYQNRIGFYAARAAVGRRRGRGGVMWSVRFVSQKGCRRLHANLTKAHIISEPEENLNLKKKKKINIFQSLKILTT